MLRTALVAAASLIGLAAVGAAATTSLSPRIANYRIDATYDQKTHVLTGREILTWRNSTRETATDLYFHLYLNAFANNRTSFMREVGDAWVDWNRWHPHGWGYITVDAIRIGGTDVTAHMQFVHPDDDNMDDRTVFRLPLDKPLPAGRTLEVEIEFTARLPRVVARAGYAGPFAMVAQWFPKIGVFEDGAWNCHQYHATTEFFADFGVYDVALTVPRDGVVGATGVLQETHDNHDGTKTLRFEAEDVHDFAWAIDPRFRVVDASIDGTSVRLLMQPNHLQQAARHLEAARAALRHYREWIGAYPYPTLTIVDPGPGAGRAGGMEYPTLITGGTTWWMPNGLRLPEAVMVHEIGHQYWYGIVATNEFEEAWLDEGINSYVEGRIMDAVYGPASYIDLFGLQLGSIGLHRLQYLAAPQHDPLDRYAWRFLDRRSYSAVSYGKAALFLDTLDNYLGHDRLRSALAAYFKRWQFRHPRRADFLSVVNRSSGEDLTWLFNQLVAGTGLLDYAVTRAEAKTAQEFAGYPFTDGHVGEEKAPQPPGGQPRFRNEVVIERLGSVRMPIDVQIVFDDGSTTAGHWDGRDRWKRFEYIGAQRVEWAVVDPKRTIPLDADLNNNSCMRGAGTRGIVRIAGRWGFWFQNLIYFLTGL